MNVQKLRFTLVYFPARGECDTLRILLAEGKEKYSYKDIEGNAYLHYREANLAFGDLPVLEDHQQELKLMGREVIFRYLANVANLAGCGDKEMAEIDMISQQCFALEKRIWEESTGERENLVEDLHKFLNHLTKILEGSMTPFLFGNKYTSADVAVFSFLESIERENGKKGGFFSLESFSLLQSYKRGILNRPTIKKMNEKGERR